MKTLKLVLPLFCFSSLALATHPAPTVLDANLGVQIGEQSTGEACRLETTFENGRYNMVYEYSPANSDDPKQIEFQQKHLFTNPELRFFVAQHRVFLDPQFIFSYDRELKFQKVRITSGFLNREIATCYMPSLLNARQAINSILEKNLGNQAGVDENGEDCGIEISNLSTFMANANVNYIDKKVNQKTLATTAINFKAEDDSISALMEYKVFNETYLKINLDGNQEAKGYELVRVSNLRKKSSTIKSCDLR